MPDLSLVSCLAGYAALALCIGGLLVFNFPGTPTKTNLLAGALWLPLAVVLIVALFLEELWEILNLDPGS